MVSKAVDEVYRKVLEDSKKQNLDITERVRMSEARLKEHMGSRASEVIAPGELPLLVRLRSNIARLKGLYNSKNDVNSQQSLVLTRLCNQDFALKEMLSLQPCVSTRLNEVLTSAMEVLGIFYSGNSASSHLKSEHDNEYSPMFQLLYPFYRTLGAIEADLLFMKGTRKVLETFHPSAILTGPSLQGYPMLSRTSTAIEFWCIDTNFMPLPSCLDSRETAARKRSFDDGSAPTIPTGNASEDSFPKLSGPKPHIIVKESRIVRFIPDDISMLEKLGHKILKKLERNINHLKCEVEEDAGMTEPESLQNGWTPALEHCFSIPPFSGNLNAGAQMQVLVSKGSTSHLCCSESTIPTLKDKYSVKCSQSRCKFLDLQGQSNPAEYGRDLANSAAMPPECSLKQSHANMSVSMLSSLPIATKPDKEVPSASCTGITRLPLIPITNNQVAPASTGKPSSQVLYPPPPPPPPPPLRQNPQQPRTLPPPPPPPPTPSSSMFGVIKARPSNSAKLKKSATISRLYLGMKKKAEGVAFVPCNAVTDASVQRRAVAGIGSREGMAEALAEITKRSEYFRKIEDDVNKQASSILYVKSQLETFQTHDMDELLRFHRSIEVHLEQLTDESQVLARFPGFPIRKLETIRAAASLHLRLTCLMEQSKNWVVEPPLSEQLEKVVTFFDKVKGDVEAVERTKDEDLKRFNCQKIGFNFEILCSIKEAVVRLSSQCLALALKESERTQKRALSVDEACTSMKELNKQRLSFQLLYRTFQLAYRVHNFAGGHNEMAEQLCSDLAREMETYPSSFWLELAPRQ
ncbi:hypothetical protein GOP47_0011027 [Adiantum capillus-veneris]|uniref:Hydroxyproline-rich glycoprotein family protein n=1 Tax=Adiantum capillus-veneris TaxID=13818 RepID=A0A9D4UW69_ADICA|nr:hypothetical protein GOP47_0010768 [Adiantum capillus-veneris]KAI5075066.1 hypothetical protein GOP47_0011027 [Adiantum capillus-veneris]